VKAVLAAVRAVTARAFGLLPVRPLSEAAQIVQGAQHDAAPVHVDGSPFLEEAKVLVHALSCDTNHAGQFVLAEAEFHLAPLRRCAGEVEQLPGQTAVHVQEGERAYKLIGRSQAARHGGQYGYGRSRVSL